MIKGMTGFSRSEFSFQGFKGSVEIKSLNNRNFDLACHFPPGLGALEERAKKILEQEFKRGRITVLINFLHKPCLRVSVNQALAQEYLSSLKKIQKALNLKGEIYLSEIVKMPGVLSVEEIPIPGQLLSEKIAIALRQAAESLLRSRSREGACLAKDISAKINHIQKTLMQMQQAAEKVFKRGESALSSDEFSAFLRSSNINEELIRLRFHLNSLKNLLKSRDSVGKELDFICQELLREINTSGAKLPDKQVSSCAIKIKSAIEKIREQVQNIE